MGRLKPKYIVVHCSDSPFGNAGMIRQWHLERGWNDIGYHFVIGNGYPENSSDYLFDYNGSLEIGRSIKLSGSHCRGMNSTSIGICLIGVDEFTEEQYDTLFDTVVDLMEKYNIPVENVIGHNETKSGQKQGKTCPNFNVEELRVSIEGEFIYPHNFVE